MKWTLITGGAIRLGAEIARELAKSGYNIVIHFNKSKTPAQKLKNDIKKIGVHCEIISGDFNSSSAVQDFLNRYDFDTENLIHNVGNFLIEGPLETSMDNWENLFQTNLFAPVQITKELVPQIIKHKGRIVTIGVTGINTARADIKSTAYTQTKTSLLGFTKALAVELAPRGVTVNMVSPGQLDNSIDLKDPSKLPMKRAGKTRDVARMVKFLLEPESSYITGQNIEVAGALRL
jgi:NAD(P)-dependent dehydrogenase (short-subunit alcohol dehydrogenase family)